MYGLNSDFQKRDVAIYQFAEFTLTKEDAVRYLYADSTKHRVHRWKDIKVSLYI